MYVNFTQEHYLHRMDEIRIPVEAAAGDKSYVTCIFNNTIGSLSDRMLPARLSLTDIKI